MKVSRTTRWAVAGLLSFCGAGFAEPGTSCKVQLAFSYSSSEGRVIEGTADVAVPTMGASAEMQATLLVLSAGRGVQAYLRAWHADVATPPELVKEAPAKSSVIAPLLTVQGFPIRPPVPPATTTPAEESRGKRYATALRRETQELRNAFQAIGLPKTHPLTRQVYDLEHDLEALALAFERSSDHRTQYESVRSLGAYALSAVTEAASGMVLSSGGTMTDKPFWENVREGYVPDEDTFSLEGYLKRFRLVTDVTIPEALRDRAVIPLGDAFYEPKQQKLFLKLVYAANIDPAKYVRPDLNLVFAVDISGSMGTQDTRTARNRLEGALAVLTDMMRNLRANDRVAVVVFDDKADTLIAPTRVGDVDRGTLVDALQGVKTRGATDIGKAQALGYQLLAQMAPQNRNAQNRLVLITDAQTNTGEVNYKALTLDAQRAASRRDQPAYTTVVGVGRGFNQELSVELASNPGGMFFYAKDGDELYRLFAQFDTRMVTFATNFSASVVLTGFPPNARIVAVHGSGIDDPRRAIALGQPLDGQRVFDVPTFAFADRTEIDSNAGGGAFILEIDFGGP